MAASVQERRRFLRQDVPARVSVNLLEPSAAGPVTYVNYSEGGLCLRLTQALDVRTVVRMRLRPEDASHRPISLTGRVAWVMQRLDLRTAAPLFDIGIEFTDAVPKIQQALGRRLAGRAAPRRGSGSRAASGKPLEPSSISGRLFVPQLDKTVAPHGRWHLVVAVEGVPCFSGHYDSERAALLAWDTFQSRQARRPAKRARAS